MIGRHVRTHARRRSARSCGTPSTRAEESGDRASARTELLDYVGVASARQRRWRKHLAVRRPAPRSRSRVRSPPSPSCWRSTSPAAGMNATETASLQGPARRTSARDGTTILLIEHDMKLVMSVCDRVLGPRLRQEDRRRIGGGCAEGPGGDRRRTSAARSLLNLEGRQRAGAGWHERPRQRAARASRVEIAYGGIHAVKGIDLHRRQGRARVPDRHQRRRQDDHAQGHHRPAARQGGTIRYAGENVTGRPAFELVRKGSRDGSRGPRRVRRADHRGKPGDGRIHPERHGRDQGRTSSACSRSFRA